MSKGKSLSHKRAIAVFCLIHTSCRINEIYILRLRVEWRTQKFRAGFRRANFICALEWRLHTEREKKLPVARESAPLKRHRTYNSLSFTWRVSGNHEPSCVLHWLMGKPCIIVVHGPSYVQERARYTTEGISNLRYR